MDKERKKLLEAAKFIKDYCKKYPHCRGCPFAGCFECTLVPDNSDGFYPSDWEVPNE